MPRFGGGWMHQFGHVYALQQELLSQTRVDWFHAAELWHTARHEGLALNSAHYTNILRQCVRPAQWQQALVVLRQMRRDAIRPDVVGVACAMASCAEAGQWQAGLAVFHRFEPVMQLDSQCYVAAMRCCNSAAQWNMTLEMGERQHAAHVPMLPATYVPLLEACDWADDADKALAYVRQLSEERWPLLAKGAMAAKRLCVRHGRDAEYTAICGPLTTEALEPLCMDRAPLAVRASN